MTTPPGADRSEDLARVLRRHLDAGLVHDGWRPAVQGAVAPVVGLVAGDGTPLVAKVFPPDAARRGLTEATALELLGPLADVPTPRLVHHGVLPGDRGSVVVMTRLPGARWADRQGAVDQVDRRSLAHQAAHLLREMHTLTADRFGGLLPDDHGHRSLPARVQETADRHLELYRASGGPVRLADRVRRLLLARRDVWDRPVRAVCCHHDLNGGNVLVTAAGAPRITGLVDLERAGWDDPMADLALTTAHLRQHDTDAAAALLEGYQPDQEERCRLELHVVLIAVAERAWVATDRPHGWEKSVDRLDALLLAST